MPAKVPSPAVPRSLRATPEEWAKIDKAAAKAEVTRTEFVIGAALERAGAPKPPTSVPAIVGKGRIVSRKKPNPTRDPQGFADRQARLNKAKNGGK